MGRTACTEPQCLYKGALYLLFYYKHHATEVFQVLYASVLIREYCQHGGSAYV